MSISIRLRPRALLIALFAVAGLATSWVMWVPRPTDEAPARVTADNALDGDRAPGPAPAPPVDPVLRSETTSLGRGGTMAASLDRLGVPSDLRQPLLETIGEQVDLRRLSPQTGVVARIDESGAWRALAIRAEPERLLQVDIAVDVQEPVLESRWIELPLDIEVRNVSGIVDSSVAQALASEPHGTLVTLAFADVFQWDVDLLVEPRPGDRVRIVYETKSLGRVPESLPSFGSAASRSGEFVEVGRILAASYAGRIASADAFWVEDGEGRGDYYDAEGRPMRKTFLKSPLNYRRISSRFSRARRNPVTRRVVPHHGVDYAAAAGTPVVAASDGRVVSAGWDGALGRAIKIRHGSEYVTVYGHLRAFAGGIRRGVEVRQNQVVGYVGSSGRATGPHLHYSMIHRGRAIDPMKMENPPVEPLDPALLPSLRIAVQRWRPLLDLGPDEGLELARRDPESPRRRIGPGA
jgi:murein DD-endopeptidase MepM/ murein hydrolase activator NlpD